MFAPLAYTIAKAGIGALILHRSESQLQFSLQRATPTAGEMQIHNSAGVATLAIE